MIRKITKSQDIGTYITKYNSTLKNLLEFLGKPDTTMMHLGEPSSYEWDREFFTNKGWQRCRIIINKDSILKHGTNIKELDMKNVKEIELMTFPWYKETLEAYVDLLINKKFSYAKDIIKYILGNE